MRIKEVTLSKTVKLPIPGVAFSSKQPSVTLVFDATDGEFDISKAVDELNKMLTIVKEEDPEWIRESSEEFRQKRLGENNEE